MRALSFVAALLCLCGAAVAQPKAPPGLLPPLNLGDLLNPSTARDNIGSHQGYNPIRVWKPQTGPDTIDTSGSEFATRTGYLAVEVDGTPTAAQIIFQNQGTTSYTIIDASIAGSSELAASGYTGSTPAIDAFDSSGTVATVLCDATTTAICWRTLSFGNGGADSSFPSGTFPLNVPPAAIPYVTGSTSSSTSLNFGAFPANVALHQKVIIPATTGTFPALATEDTYVTAVPSSGCGSSCTVTIGPVGLTNSLPSGNTVYFLPLGVTVGISPAPPVPNLAYSDWVNVTTYPGLDRQPKNGQALSGPSGLAGGTTVSGTPVNGLVTLSAPTTGYIPANNATSPSTITSCSTLTNTVTATPVYTLPFSTTAGVVAGMNVILGGANNLNGGTGAPWGNGAALHSPQGAYHTTVASVSANTSVTMTTPLPSDFTAGDAQIHNADNVEFVLPFNLTQNAATNDTTIYVTPGLTIAGSGTLSLVGTNVANGTTITSYNSGTGVMVISLGLSAGLSAGDPLGAGINYTVNGNTSVGTTLTMSGLTNSEWFLQGGYVTGPNFPGKDWIILTPGGNTFVLMYSPTAAIASSTTFTACRDFKIQTAALPGSTTIQIYPPKRLVLLRINPGPDHTNYWSYFATNRQPYREAAFGLPFWLAGRCGASTDGVLTPTNITNTSGSCGTAYIPIPYAIKFYTPGRGITIATLNCDSHCDNRQAHLLGISEGLAAAFSTPTFQVSSAELGWTGQSSPVFRETALQFLQTARPDIVLMMPWTWNNALDQNSLALLNNEATTVINTVQSYGGLPVVLDEYVRQLYGCNNSPSGGEPIRQQSLAFWNALAATNQIVFNTNTALDPTNSGFFGGGSPGGGAGYQYTNECQHENDAGAKAQVNALIPILQRYMGN